MKPFILSLVLASLPLPVIGQATASGSGFFVSRAGHLITNEHVVADANEILVTLADGKQLPATVLLANPAKDIAVLKIDAQTTPLWLGESDQVDVLDPVSMNGVSPRIETKPAAS
jgi:S1-C subfamily serine protease